MPNWHDVLEEINQEQQAHILAANTVLDRVRRKYLTALANLTGRNTICYYSAFLTKTNVEGIDITDEDKNSFMTCINGMDRSKGLDLVLHTPGGGIAATESLVHYLRQMFGRDIRAIVPQISMSAGTMLALSCKSILMGKQSCLGPIDPQIAGIPADVVVTEFKRAFEEIKADPQKAHVWAPILNRYSPSFLSQCEYAVEWSATFVQAALEENMLADSENRSLAARSIVQALSSAAANKAHNKHIHSEQLKSLGISIESLELNQELQDAVLTVHHSYIHTMTSTSVLKIVENDNGRAVVRHLAQQIQPQAMSLGFGNPG
jgi:membrane-bound ClpP family serine protease